MTYKAFLQILHSTWKPVRLQVSDNRQSLLSGILVNTNDENKQCGTSEEIDIAGVPVVDATGNVIIIPGMC